jgi:hypothetical protein
MLYKQFTDKFGSKYKYSTQYPIGTPFGQNLYNKFEQSELWKLVEKESRVSKKNDNRMDVFLGMDISFKNVQTGDVVNIKSSHSNTGKTVNWTFESENETESLVF